MTHRWSCGCSSFEPTASAIERSKTPPASKRQPSEQFSSTGPTSGSSSTRATSSPDCTTHSSQRISFELLAARPGTPSAADRTRADPRGKRRPQGLALPLLPQGNAQIGAEAVETAGRTVAATLSQLASQTAGPAELVAAYLDKVEEWMHDSDFRSGSPITTTLLEMAPDNEAIRAAGHAAFEGWATIIRASALADGISADDADQLAWFALAAIEGALVQSRTARDGAPLGCAAQQIQTLVTALKNADR